MIFLFFNFLLAQRVIIGYLIGSGSIAYSMFLLKSIKERIFERNKFQENVVNLTTELDIAEENTQNDEKVKSIGPR